MGDVNIGTISNACVELAVFAEWVYLCREVGEEFAIKPPTCEFRWQLSGD